MTGPGAGALSRLLRELAEIPAADLASRHLPRLAPGARVGRFEIRGEIGRGGFGVVYAAEDTALGRPVALKLVRPRADAAPGSDDRLQREAEAVARLNHPAIVTLHDVGRTDAGAYLVFELLEGETLAARLARGPVPLAEALRIATEIARALVHAHAAEVLHRDLKPANVFLCRSGAVKVLDFGIAHLFGAEGDRAGTPAYMAPETWDGTSAEPRGDLYALGVVLHELLHGVHPARAPAGAPRGRVPRTLAALVEELLATEPAHRPASAAVALARLERARRSIAAGARRRALAAAGVAVAAAVAVAGWLAQRRAVEDAPASELAARASAVPGALAAYHEGVACMARPVEHAAASAVAVCGAHFRRALALDPAFPLAHYRLAFLLGRTGGDPDELRGHVDAAVRGRGRAAVRDALLIDAWAAHLDGRDGEARAAYEAILARRPDDVEVLYLLGDLLFHGGDRAAAVPYFQKVLALDPAAEWPLDHLVNGLAMLRRRPELEALAARLQRTPASPARASALARAHVWLGDPAAAVRVARAAVAGGGGAAAAADLAAALSAAGAFAEAEALARDRLAAAPRDPGAWWALAGPLVAQGRRAEAWEIAAGLAARTDDLLPAEDAAFKAILAAGDRDADRLWRETAKVVALDGPELPQSSVPVVLLALAGDPERARALVPRLPEGSAARDAGEALLAWRGGDAAAGLARLLALERREPSPDDAPAPAYLLAEVAAAAGDHAETAAAVARFRQLWPRGMWRSWAWPRAALLSARALRALGRCDEADAELARLAALRAGADPGDPLRAAAEAARAAPCGVPAPVRAAAGG